jgi:ribonucleoside-diphosphate reductase subunit M1
MYVRKEDRPGGSVSNNGVPTPSTTPPPIKLAGNGEVKRPLASPSKPVPFKADILEGDSPKALPTEPSEKIQLEELKDPALSGKKDGQSEDKEDESNERETDIYSDAVLACK